MKSTQKNKLIVRTGLENELFPNPVDYAINHLTKAQRIMHEELEGDNPYGMYSEFGTLIKLLTMYKNSTLKAGI